MPTMTDMVLATFFSLAIIILTFLSSLSTDSGDFFFPGLKDNPFFGLSLSFNFLLVFEWLSDSLLVVRESSLSLLVVSESIGKDSVS